MSIGIILLISSVIIIVIVMVVIEVCRQLQTRFKNGQLFPVMAPDTRFQTFTPDTRFQTTVTMDKFLYDMQMEKPIRFTSQQLQFATHGFTAALGSGGFGTVYKAHFGDGTVAAVKVLHYGLSYKRVEEQFMAEVSTIGRTHHLNLVRLHGFCFDKTLRALVYEFMPNGSLDELLFRRKADQALGLLMLRDIAVGTARGIAYLHDECPQRIIHYDIKPANILLDMNFQPKVADFGLAKLVGRDDTHVSMTGGRGTPGYAAPELWMPFPVTHKCDVYSFGMLLFEIVGQRRNVDEQTQESREWMPRWVWRAFESGALGEVMGTCGIEKKDREVGERMAKVALLCAHNRPELRPVMGDVVKMLEGSLEIPTPSDPFPYTHPPPPSGYSSSLPTTCSTLGSSGAVTKQCEIHVAFADAS